MPLCSCVASGQLCSLLVISSSPVGRESQGSRTSAELISGVVPRTGTTRCMAIYAPCCWSGFVIPLFNALRGPRLRSDARQVPPSLYISQTQASGPRREEGSTHMHTQMLWCSSSTLVAALATRLAYFNGSPAVVLSTRLQGQYPALMIVSMC
ncbi:hypothetical protein MRX96_022797 [Rhipicephalus microplus]